jgi:hypothetical protein
MVKNKSKVSSAKRGMSAAARRAQLAFANATSAAMLELGAKQTRDAYDNGPEALVIYAGEFTTNTKAGPLVVQAYGDWIPTRFEDAERGAALTTASMNGKWNWYPHQVGVLRGKRDEGHKTLTLFLEHLRPILLAPGERPPPARAPGKFDRALHLALIGHDGYAKHDFATRQYFKKSLLPSVRASTKRESRPLQVVWQDGVWQVWAADVQPTARAFAVVDVSGKWRPGPRYDEDVLSDDDHGRAVGRRARLT